MPYGLDQLRLLRQELDADPLSRGYAVMSDAAAVASLAASNRAYQRDTLDGNEILAEIDPTEFAAIPTNQPTRYTTVMGICGTNGPIPVGPNTFARAALLNIFGSGSQTVARLAARLNATRSRADELGLPPPTLDDVQRARGL